MQRQTENVAFPESLRRRFLSATGWQLGASLLSRGLAFLASIAIARILGKDAFGQLAIIQVTVTLLVGFAGLGISLTITKYLAEFRIVDPMRAGRILVLSNYLVLGSGALAALILWVIAPQLAGQAPADSEMEGLLRTSSLLILISALFFVQSAALTGLEAFRAIARVSLIEGVASFPILIGSAYWFGIYGAVVGTMLSKLIGTVLMHVAVRNLVIERAIPLPFGPKEAAKEIQIIKDFSIPSYLSTLTIVAVGWFSMTVLARQTEGYGEVAIYAAADQWYTAVLFLPTILYASVLPLMSERLAANAPEQGRALMWIAIKTNALVVVPVALIGSLGSPWLMALYGPGFEKGWGVMVLTVWAAALAAVQGPVVHLIVASGRMWIAFLLCIGWAATFVGAALALVQFGSIGLAAAKLLAYILQLVVLLIYARRFVLKGEATIL